MNGVHDLGGMDGFTLPARDQDFPLREEWERELWGVIFALRGVPGSGGGARATIERMPPELYLSYPYFAKLLYARERILIDNGVVTPEELANPDGPMTPERARVGVGGVSSSHCADRNRLRGFRALGARGDRQGPGPVRR
jgi:nitrile hydratase